jgi:hypothetical protein
MAVEAEGEEQCRDGEENSLAAVGGGNASSMLRLRPQKTAEPVQSERLDAAAGTNPATAAVVSGGRPASLGSFAGYLAAVGALLLVATVVLAVTVGGSFK